MRAACLLGVFLLAKLALLGGRELPHSVWTPLAWVWQDLAAALLFALVDAALRPAWLGWMAYGLAVAYVAVNVPVAQVLSSPLTWTMLRAARPELGDSIRYYLTPQHLSWLALVGATGIALPLAARRLGRAPGQAPLLLALTLLAGLGRWASQHVDTGGVERNALLALVSSALPRVGPHYAADPWRSSPFEAPPPAGLEHYRGAGAGRSVVLVVLESAGARYLRPYGAPRDPTPNLTELAQRAIVFENAYAVYPESVKGLISILCSQYPAFDTDPEAYRRLRAASLARQLAGAGYRMALFHSGRFMYLGMRAVVEDRGFDTLEDAGTIGGHRESSFGVEEASAARRILAWIDTLPRGQAFFIAYLPIAGHHPYATAEPGPFPEEREIDRYHNALFEADRALGELVRGLRARGLERSLLWVVLGDHGEAFGQHRGNYGHTLFIYEENVRVPFLISLPGAIEEEVRVKTPVSLLDTAPTILDLLGQPIPVEYQGASLLRDPPGMALFYTDYSLGLLGLRDGCMKYVYELESRRSRLYELCRDPEERRDLAPAFPARVDFYRRRLERWSAAQKEKLARAAQLSRSE